MSDLEAEIDRILSMSEDELRAELRGEGRDPDQVIADMRARLEAVRSACETFAESEARLVAENAQLKVDASNHAADATVVRQERDRADLEAMALHKALQRAVKAMERATLFITSKERIKHPEGDDWWEDEKAAARAALTPIEPRPAATVTTDGGEV